MKKESGKRWRVALFAVAAFMALVAGASQNNATGGLILAGIICLLFLPYMIEDWVLPKVRAKKGPKSAPEVKPEMLKPEMKPVQKPEPGPQPKPEVKPVQRPEAKPVQKPATQPSRLSVYSEGIHGDQLDIVCRDDQFFADAWNDGYPNPGGGGGRSMRIPDPLVWDYSHERFARWVRGNFWMKGLAAADLQVSEDRVCRFFCEADPEAWARARRRMDYSDGYYSYHYMEDGGISVGHRPQDRMSSDPAEGYLYTREQLSRVRREDFIEWFGGRWNGDRARRGLAGWLDELAVGFAEGDGPTPRELEPWNLGKDAGAGEARPKWVTDEEEIFHLSEVSIDGSWHTDRNEVWCDARNLDREQLLGRLATRNPEYASHWYIVIGPDMAADIRDLAEDAPRRWPNWTLQWLVPQEPVPEGALRLWLAPLEGQRYCTRVTWAGYSHDGSEDYFALTTARC